MGAGVMPPGGGTSGRRGNRRRRGRVRPMAEINVTPFVDVLLVLLIIFMVAAPLMTVGVPVELPKTAATALPSQTEEPLTITLTAQGDVLIQKTPIAPEDLVPRLRAISEERSDDRVYLRSDGTVPYEAVAQIMGALNAGGFSSIGLVTDVGGPTLDGASVNGTDR
ncbi:MAG: ExbD/TolR family protein [Paracoccaceae bacterium]